MDTSVTSCLNILRRTPPCDTEQNLTGLIHLLQPNEANIEDLLQRVDAPLKLAYDPNADNQAYIICDHNRDGDSYRSPWSNNYYPPLDKGSNNNNNNSGLKPNYELRQLEKQANEVFSIYRELYYGKGTKENPNQSVSSVYMWDTSQTSSTSTSKNTPVVTSASVGSAMKTINKGFAAIFLIRKELEKGFWNSIHVIDVSPLSPGSTCTYKLTTTILISIDCDNDNNSNSKNQTKISGSLTRQVEKICSVDKEGTQHLEHMGKMMEDTEHFLRVNMDSLYIQKTHELVKNIRPGGEDCDYEENRPKMRDTSKKQSGAGAGAGAGSGFHVGVRGGNAMHASLLSQAILKRASQNKE